MNKKQIIGWIVSVVGLLVIGQAINLSFQYFTANQDFPAVFKIAAVNQDVATPASATQTTIDAQAQMQQAASQATNQAIAGMFPVENINKLLNAIV